MKFDSMFKGYFIFVIITGLISLAALIGGGYWLLSILEQAVQ